MARTTVSARIFNDALMDVTKEIVVKNSYNAMIEEKNKCDYIYVDRYEGAARLLQSKYTTSYLTACLDQIDQLNAEIAFWQSQIDKLKSNLSINKMPKPTVAESIEYYQELINENKNQIESIITINDTAPESIRNAMRTLVNYNEYNDYYLMLDGHPGTDTDDTARVYVYNENFNEMLPIDEQPYAERVRWMNSVDGISFINAHKNESKYKYLQYMTSKKIRPFIARAAGRFDILYCPQTDPSVLRDDFMSIYKMSLNYILTVFYSDAYRIPEPQLYEGFIGMAILFMSIGEMHYKYLDVDISRDFYDLDSLKIIYEAYSVPFYDIIPLKYHKKIVKNINRLLRYKGSNQVFFDLCDIFDYDILGIFQYYLFKERKLDKNNDPYVVWKTTDGKEVTYDNEGNPTNLPVDIDGKPIWEPDLQSMYEIYFVKANINKDRYTQLIDPNNKVTYDSIVNEDSYWFQFDPDTVKTIYENVYNYIETKYIGVQLMFNMTDLLWESSYFMGMLRDNRSKISNSRFMISHDRLGTNVPLFDMLIYIIALICKKRGYTGEIRGLFYKVDDNGNYLDRNGNITTNPSEYIETPTKTARILGFNFKGLLKGLQAIKDPFNQDISHREKTVQGYHIKKDFNENETFHPADIAIGNDFFHGDYIQDWIQKNKGFSQSDEGRNLLSRIFNQKSNSTKEAETAYFENLHITSMEDISRAFKAMKNMKLDIDTLLYNTHDREEYNALRDLQRLLYTTEIVTEVFEDDITGELAISYYSLLESLNPQLANRYNDMDIDINDELDYCLIQLQNLCDELKYMIYIDQLDIDIITQYLYKMLEFFKSAKADLTDFNIIFYISDRSENCLKFIERMYKLISTVWIDDPIQDWFDRIEKGSSSQLIEDRSMLFHFVMEVINSLSSKKIIIDDGWEANLMSEYNILISSKDNPINLNQFKETGNFISLYIDGDIPDELRDPKTPMCPYQISNRKIDDEILEQTIYALPIKYKRTYQNNNWSPFIKTDMKASVYLSDRFSNSRTPAVSNLKFPIFDKFANIGLYGNIRKGYIKELKKDELVFRDRISKI